MTIHIFVGLAVAIIMIVLGIISYFASSALLPKEGIRGRKNPLMMIGAGIALIIVEIVYIV